MFSGIFGGDDEELKPAELDRLRRPRCKIKRKWSVKARCKEAEFLARSRCEPIGQTAVRIYAASADGNVISAIDPETGKTALAGNKLGTGITCVGPGGQRSGIVVVVAENGGYLIALDSEATVPSAGGTTSRCRGARRTAGHR